MLSIKQLLYYTQIHRRSILDKASRAAIKVESVTTEEDGDGDDFTMVQATVVGSTSPRHVEIHLYGKGPNAKVWASCDCPYFLYHCEVADTKKGSSDVIFSNGKSPRITNKNMVPHLCKHIAACFLRNVGELKPFKHKKSYKR